MDFNPESAHVERLCFGAMDSFGLETPERGLSYDFTCRYFYETAYFNQILWETGDAKR